MYCPKCGYKCDDDAQFCPNCGTSLHAEKNDDEIDDTYAQKIDIEAASKDYTNRNQSSSSNQNLGTYGLVLSLVGLFIPYVGLLCEVAAIVLGSLAKGTLTEKNGKIGRIVAIVGLVLWIFGIMIIFMLSQ